MGHSLQDHVMTPKSAIAMVVVVPLAAPPGRKMSNIKRMFSSQHGDIRVEDLFNDPFLWHQWRFLSWTPFGHHDTLKVKVSMRGRGTFS